MRTSSVGRRSETALVVLALSVGLPGCGKPSPVVPSAEAQLREALGVSLPASATGLRLQDDSRDGFLYFVTDRTWHFRIPESAWPKLRPALPCAPVLTAGSTASCRYEESVRRFFEARLTASRAEGVLEVSLRKYEDDDD